MQRPVKALLHVLDRRLVLGTLHPQRKKYRITCSITSSGSATSTTSTPSPINSWASRQSVEVFLEESDNLGRAFLLARRARGSEGHGDRTVPRGPRRGP
jgi:hypothetical protein